MRVFLEYWDRWFEIQPGETVIGRDHSCPIQLDDEAISRRHLRLWMDVATRSIHVEDLLSTNGTRLNDAPLESRCQLSHGDVIQLGHGVLVVHQLEENDYRVDDLSGRAIGEQEHDGPIRRDPTTALLSTCPFCHQPLPGPDVPCPACAALEAPNDRRHQPRIQIQLPVRYKSSSARFSSLVCDISLGGAFIASRVSEPPVTSCLVTIAPEDGPPFSAEAEVRHVMPIDSAPGHPAGFGIKFTALEYRGRQWIYNAVQGAMNSFSDTSASF